jgi:hypothetical protein
MPKPKAVVAPVRGIFHPSAGLVIEVQPNNVAVLPDLFLVFLLPLWHFSVNRLQLKNALTGKVNATSNLRYRLHTD